MQNEKIFIYTVQKNQRNFARNSFKLKKLWFNIVISNRFSSGHHLTIWSLSGKPFCLKMLLELHAQKRNLIGADRQNLLKNTTIAPGEVQTYAYFNSIAIFNNRCCNTNQRSFVSFFFAMEHCWILNFWPFKMTESNVKCVLRPIEQHVVYASNASHVCETNR